MSKSSMATIGMLGGMSWESSVQYYKLANELVREKLGGLHSAKCLVYSVDFAEIEGMQAAGNWDLAGEVLAEAARDLERAGADFVLLCTNTMHIVSDRIEDAIEIPLLDIREVTATAVRRAGLHRVGLLATSYTMEQTFYRGRLERAGLEVIVPEHDDRAEVHRIIFEELCLGIITDVSRAKYLDVIDRLRATGCEGVVLGCTEIESLVSPDDCPTRLFPTTRLHVEAAVERAIACS